MPRAFERLLVVVLRAVTVVGLGAHLAAAQRRSAAAEALLDQG